MAFLDNDRIKADTGVGIMNLKFTKKPSIPPNKVNLIYGGQDSPPRRSIYLQAVTLPGNEFKVSPVCYPPGNVQQSSQLRLTEPGRPYMPLRRHGGHPEDIHTQEQHVALL